MRIALGFRFIPAATAMAFVALAQTGSPDQTKPQIRSLSHAIHAVEDLDTTLAFYREVFGLNGMPQDFPNPAVPLLTNAPGVTLRLSMMRLPGAMLFELTHFKGLERKPARAAYTDPGAASIVFYVRDIDAAVANAKKANATIVTTGGAPVEITTAKGKARSILLARSRRLFRSGDPGNARGRCAGRKCASRFPGLHDGERRGHGQVL